MPRKGERKPLWKGALPPLHLLHRVKRLFRFPKPVICPTCHTKLAG